MVLKLKFLAALAAAAGLECASPVMPANTADATETGTSQQALTLAPLPPTPAMGTARTWEPGIRTGIQSYTGLHVHLVLLKDPYSTANRVLAYGFDPAARINLFTFNLAMSQVAAFQHQWVIDSDAWRLLGSGSIKSNGSTDGIGGGEPIPIPRPGFMEALGWKHAFYAWQMHTQINQEAGLQ